MSDASPHPTVLDLRHGVIHVRGPDAATFLHAQLSNSIQDLQEGEIRLAAWCSAKGRVLALFRVLRQGEDIYLSLPRSQIAATLPRLKMFVLRSQVQMDDISDQPDAIKHLPAEFIGHAHLRQIQAGLPEVYPETKELFLPQMLNLHWLNGIDFRKGCYPGQEIIARTQYLGQLKRRMYLAQADTTNIPTPGTAVLMGTTGETAGTVVDAATEPGGQLNLLAVLQIDSTQQPLRLGNSDGPLLKLLELPYPVST